MYEESELGVISCLMQRPECVEDVYSMLAPEMFSAGILGRAYYEFRKAYDNRKGLTLIELHQLLQADYQSYEIEDALKNCALSNAMSFQIKAFAEVLVRHYKASRVGSIMSRMELREADIDDQIAQMIGELESLQGGNVSEGSTIAQITEKYKDQYFNGEEKKLLYLGEEGLDEMTGGFQGGDLVILAARPACGKSALAMQWALIFAQQGKKVGYYNLEMQTQSVFERLVASKTGIEIVRLRKATRFLNDEEEKYTRAISELTREKNVVMFTGAKSAADIRKDQREYGFSIIIIDYLQLMNVANRYQGNRAAEVAEISRDLKGIAMYYDIPILALSQLSRASESRRDREPMMSDIRESGAIEQDASIIFMLWNADEEDRSKKGFKVEKSRAGKCARADLVFDGSHMSFTMADNVAPFGA